MKIYSLFICAFLLLSSSTSAQDPHVHTRYVTESKTTVVETDLMYIINTPQQFVQLGLVTRYPKERLEKPPKKIDLLIWSFSKEVMHREEKEHTVKFNIDGETWSISPQLYVVFKGESKGGQDIFWSEKRPDLGQPSLLPDSALVKAKEGINNLFMEQIFVELKPEQLQKMAGAKKVEIQIGRTRLEFTSDYMSTIREFNNRLIPGAQPAIDTSAKQPQKPADEPIDVGVVNGMAISLPRPEYTSLARGARASGDVKVFVTIDEKGKVVAARAITGHPLLREAAEAAAKEARFKPPLVSGQPVKVSGIIIYSFVP